MQNNNQGIPGNGNAGSRNGQGRAAGNVAAASAANGQVGPNVKDDSLKHVPCKFYRQGNCTAGDSCVFSHQAASTELCKYYLKGNCKFGNKCALVHGAGGNGRFRRRVSSNIGGGNGGNSTTAPSTPAGGGGGSRASGHTSGSNQTGTRASQPSTPNTLLNQRSLVMQSADRVNNAGGGHLPRSPGMRSPLQLPLTSAALHSGLYTGVSVPSPGLGHNTGAFNLFGTGLDMGTGNPLGYDFPIGDAYRLYDTANTHTGISDALGGSTGMNSISIPSRQPSLPTLLPSTDGHHLAMDSSQAAAGGRPRPRPLRSATVSLMNGVAASEFMSITSPALSSSFGGANQGLGEVAIPRTPDFATSPFGGERSFLLSLSYEGRSSESPLSASLQARRNQLRVTNLLTQRGASGTNGDNIDHLGDDVEPGIDRDDGSELGYDDFQPEFFPSSLDELLTPSELEKRRRREHSKMSDELRRGMLGGLSQGFTGETGELQPPVSPTKQPLQHHWRAAAALSPISPFTRGIPMSMPNHSSLSDYDRFDVLHTSMAVGSIGSIGTPAASPGAWNRPDPLLMGSISAAVGSHTTIGPNIQHSMLNNNNNNSNSINNNNTHNNYGDPSLGHSALSPDVTKGNTAFNSLTEPRFSFHLDDDVPFRMDDVPESSPLPSGLSTQTASTIAANHPSANATATNAASGLLSPSSPNELGLSNTIGSPLGSNDLTSRLAGLHLDANGQTASTSLNPWS